MIDRDALVQLAPHYLVMLVLAIGTLSILKATAGDLNFLVETAAAALVLIVYRPIVLRLGIAPPQWEQRG